MGRLIAEKYRQWEQECEERFNRLKANEEELNQIFIRIYGLQDELSPEVQERDVTVRKADLQREIKSLISYAIGCLFGRYSPDVEGLCYAGGQWDPSKYKTVLPVEDNILVICDEAAFDGDLASRFVQWVEAVYGKETLEENLQFIADALGGKGSAREVIRHYLFTGFYDDHVKLYRKRPIYWQFSSGKHNGFKALIYMHRYEPELPERMCSGYVPQRRRACSARLTRLKELAAAASAAEGVLLNKMLVKLQDQLQELDSFEGKLRNLADRRIDIDPDEGVKANYAKLQEVLSVIS